MALSSKNNIIKIAVVGPESTGKSTIAEKLAKELQTLCVPEYARYYCQDLNKQYTLQDELNMFYGQIALENAIVSQSPNNIVICDTTILTVKIWSDHLFQNTPTRVLEEIAERKYDLYLLMDIDLPWEDDPLRDFPNQREYFMNVWKHELQNLNANFEIISGQGLIRFSNAMECVKRFIEVTP